MTGHLADMLGVMPGASISSSGAFRQKGQTLKLELQFSVVSVWWTVENAPTPSPDAGAQGWSWCAGNGTGLDTRSAYCLQRDINQFCSG